MSQLLYRRDKMALDPNAPGKRGSLFGLESTAEKSKIIIIPVPWGVTVSYRGGSENGPGAVLEASSQVDLYYSPMPDAWKMGMAFYQTPTALAEKAKRLRKKAQALLIAQENGASTSRTDKFLREVNQGGEELRKWLENTSAELLKKGKWVGVLGGDHSVPLGFMEALGEHYGEYGVLHIDAHFDLRLRYEGFLHSHASIMRNASALKKISKFVHVGIREYCEEEVEYLKSSGERHTAFYDRSIKEEIYNGRSWKSICGKIIAALPERVYVSFDIDGLKPYLCPHTGTPVPGGLEFEQAFFLFEKLAKSGRKIIGFDLCEVAPGSKDRKNWQADWDAFVGALALYRLSALMAKSQSLVW